MLKLRLLSHRKILIMHHETEALFSQETASQEREARWLIILRLVVVLLSMSVMFMIAPNDDPLGPMAVYGLILGMAVLDFLYLLVLRLKLIPMKRFIEVQMLGDILAEFALVFLTGGPKSPYVFLFFFSIMGAGILLSQRANAFFTCLSTVSLSAVVLMHNLGILKTWIPPVFAPPIDIVPEAARLLLIVTGFFLVSFLCGVLRLRLRVSRFINEEILLNMPEGVVVFDADGKALFANEEFRILFNMNRAEHPITGERAERLFHKPDLEPIANAVFSNEAERFELPEKKDEPQRPPLEIRTTPVGTDATVQGKIVLFIDLSLRNRLEDAERRAERYEAVSEMAAGLAHEIRNPLTSVRGSIQEISRDFKEDTTQRMLCDIVIKESDRLDGIITEFLQFARQRPMRMTMVRVEDLLDEIRQLLCTRPDGAHVLMDFQISGEPIIRADVEQIRELCLNIGVNALHAMDGKGRLTIAASVMPRPKRGSISDIARPMGVLVSFMDTGPGLHPGQADMIFEPFYTTKAKGTGLGLAIARKVVQSHDGDIWAENAPGGGARFMFWIPQCGPEATERRLLEGTSMFRKRALKEQGEQDEASSSQS